MALFENQQDDFSKLLDNIKLLIHEKRKNTSNITIGLKFLISKVNYNEIVALSREIREKLNRFRPLTLGQANRISGVTPAAIMVLLVQIRKKGKNEQRT